MESPDQHTTTDHDETAETTMQALKEELRQAIEGRQRALADYANFQRRAGESETRARTLGVASIVRILIPILDQFELALGHDTADASVESVLEGVELLQQEFTKALDGAGVKKVAPGVGDAFDPACHEAMMQQPADGIEPGAISMVVQPGWSLGDLILRPAQVAIAPTDVNDGTD